MSTLFHLLLYRPNTGLVHWVPVLSNIKFKLALISPLLKKPGLPKSDLANFRPISNLNTIGKILERLALARLLPHISISPSFGPLQSAYRKYHSTETALLKLTNDIMENIDSGKITILTALDMSAAFDTLDHTTLLHRLQYTFGLSGFVITWIRSYLTNRSSFVKIDSSSSPCTTIDTGVPQGSVLGPLLFVLFISPIANVINSDQPNGNNSIISPIRWWHSALYRHKFFHTGTSGRSDWILHPESPRLAPKQWPSSQPN